MSNRIYPVSIREAAEAICGKRALILCHVNPDGDALGSATALAELLRLTGGDGKVVAPTPIPERLSFITGDTDTAYSDGMESEYDTVLAVDTASPSQLGELSFLSDKVALSFDHHENCTLYSPYVLYAGSAAAGLVILDLLLELEKMGKICGNAAGVLRRIYAALSSDTGSFKYANADHAAFAAAAEICRRLKDAPASGDSPIDSMTPADIAAALFDNVTRKDIAVRQIAYRNLAYICGGLIAVSVATVAEMTAAGLAADDLGGMVDSVRSIEGTVAGIVLKDAGNGVWRGSSRANVDFDVSAPAAKLGGGGHRRAAGFKVEADIPELACAIVEKVFGEALEAAGYTWEKRTPGGCNTDE